jgi:hypothetical protein
MEIRGPPKPFTNHAMLAHWWRKSSTCWCRHPNISTTRGINHPLSVNLDMTTFAWITIIPTILRKKVVHKTRSTQIGSTMTTFVICCKYNIHLLLRWIERWCRKNMNLFLWDMKPNILSNGGEKIPNQTIWAQSCIRSQLSVMTIIKQLRNEVRKWMFTCMFSLKWFVFLFDNYSNGGIQT